MRYIYYYQQLLRSNGNDPSSVFSPFESFSQFFPVHTYTIRHIRLNGVPEFDSVGGCDPYFDVRLGDGRVSIFNFRTHMKGKLKHYYAKHKVIDFDLEAMNIKIQGDVKLSFSDWDTFNAPDKMFHCWFNTRFIDNNYLCFHKQVLDRANKDVSHKEFNSDFSIEIFVESALAAPGEFDHIAYDYIGPLPSGGKDKGAVLEDDAGDDKDVGEDDEEEENGHQ
jgi:hypothetical protein